MRVRLATTLLLLANFAPAIAADEPPDAIRGKAFLAGSDRPAAGITLHFFGRGAPLTTVVTDAGGRFRCPIPPGLSFPAVRDGQEGPPCWMEIQGAGRWTWQPIDSGAFTQNLQMLRQTADEALMKPVKATWRDRGGLLNLEVACAPTGEVEVLVRGPGDAPTADRLVQVVTTFGPPEIRMPVTVRFDGRTDGDGRFRMRWSEGIRRLAVVVPGEGFGSTGLFEVRAGHVARTETAPLARFGSIEGRLDPALAGPSTAVVLDGGWDNVYQVACDPEGRFAVRDVRPGSYRTRLLRDKRPVGAEQVVVRVAPGRRVADVVIGPARVVPTRTVPVGMPGRHGPRPGGVVPEVAWVEGTVRDEQGRGVAGAAVYAHFEFYGGRHSAELIRKTTTDDRGRYQVRGPKQELGAPTLVVHADGRPLVLAYALAPGTEGRPATMDFTMGDAARSGSARVTVLKDRELRAGASVGLVPISPVSLPFRYGRGPDRGPDRDELEALLRPTAVTGPDGVARFTNLLPGDYELIAAERGPVHFAPWARNPGWAFATATGVCVSEGREAAFAIAIHPQPRIAQLQVLRPDGKPVASQNVSMSFGLVGESRAGAPLALDEQGRGRRDFESPGIWSIDVRFRDTELSSFPADTEPFYQADAIVPVSSGLPPDGPIRLVGVRHEPGSLRVRLLDADGRPTRGTVETLEFSNRPGFAASTDEQGVVVFRGAPGGPYWLRGFIDGPAASAPGPSLSGPDPEDAALRGHAAVPVTTAAVASDRETAAELRARPVGYVRGTFRPPAGHKVSEYSVVLDINWNAVETQQWFDLESGRFLYGPLLPGPVTYRFHHWAEDGTSRAAGVQTVEVPAGDVAHVELRPEEPGPGSAPAPGPDPHVVTGLDCIRLLQSDPGSVVSAVVLDDGKTPAFAARAMLYVPEYGQPPGSGTTDASGRLTWHGLWVTGDPKDRLGPVERPTIVVRIPGRTGAAILAMEPGRRARVTLPAPRSVKGQVTLGGRPVDARNALIRVVARYQGRGRLDEALSVETTAQADGRFELRGLTPGRYLVQAARDGIWLSSSVEQVVGADQGPAPIALDIPEPGRALTLKVVDREGRPAADWAVGLVRPEGPLASLWPASVRTGPDGTLTLRGLEAGRHTLLIGDEKERREVVVPAADGAGDRPAVERIVVPRGGP